MNSTKSSKTSGTKKSRNTGSSSAQILDVFLNSPLGQKLSGVVADRLTRIFGRRVPHEKLRQEASEASENFQRVATTFTAFKVLGVDPNADDPQSVKAMYLHLQRRFHPDGATPDLAKSKAINEAYEAICKEKGWPK